MTRDISTEPTLTLESLHSDKPVSSSEDELATSLQDVQRRLAENKLSQQAEGSSQAVACAFQDAQEIAWDTFSDSMLAYDRLLEPQLDLLEVYAYPDSRLMETVREAGGRARRFNRQDGDLSTVAGQCALYDILQKTQPKNIWVAPECRLWSSWSAFNGSRSTQAHLKLQADRQRDRVHLRLCARSYVWQTARGRHFHLEQPELSWMLSDEALKPVVQQCHQVTVDMCAFGLKTPVTAIPIRKRTTILTTNDDLVTGLQAFRCAGNHVHFQISGSIRDRTGRHLSTSRLLDLTAVDLPEW